MNNMNNIPKEQPSIAAFIIIPTRLTIDTLNAMCGLANALPNATPIAGAMPQPPALPAIRPEPASSAQASNPVEAHAPTAPQPQPASDGIPYASSDLVSEKQFGLIKVIEKKQNLTDADVCNELGITCLDAMTKRQASEFISRHEHA